MPDNQLAEALGGSEAVQDAVMAALLASLDEQQRETIIKLAISSLNQQASGSSFGRGPTVLQQAFDQAVHRLAFKAVQEMVENDPSVRQAIEAAVREGIDKLVAESSELHRVIADGIASTMRGR